MAFKGNIIPGMPSKQDLSNKKKKKKVDQCVWNKKKKKIKNTIIINFCFLSGNGFELEINRFANISSIISKIDDMIKLILNIDQDKIAYELIYKNEIIDHIQQISIYYEEKYPIVVKMISYSFYDRHDMCNSDIDTFTDDEYYLANFLNLHNDSIVLYDVDEDFSNVIGIPMFILIDKLEKINYGCRCNLCSPVGCNEDISFKDVYICRRSYKTNTNYKCYHDYIVSLKIKQTRCCNIFILTISELCEECRESLYNLFNQLYIKYVSKHRITIFKNHIGDAFFIRFKDIITQFFKLRYILVY